MAFNGKYVVAPIPRAHRAHYNDWERMGDSMLGLLFFGLVFYLLVGLVLTVWASNLVRDGRPLSAMALVVFWPVFVLAAMIDILFRGIHKTIKGWMKK